MAVRLVENVDAEWLELKIRQDRAHIAEGFVKGRDLVGGGVPELRAHAVENGMAQLVAEDVWAFARINGPERRRGVEEREPLAIVVGIQVGPLVERHGK